MHRSVRVSLAVVLLLSVGWFGAPSAGATGRTTCKSFVGNAILSPPLPKVGSTELVRPKISITGAKLSGCGGAPKSGKASATLQFNKRSNCLLLVTQSTKAVVSRATGKLTITWNNRKTSTIALTLSFGAVPSSPSLATMAGTVTAGLYKGTKSSGTLAWSLGSDECFGGAPLKSMAFSEFVPFALK